MNTPLISIVVPTLGRTTELHALLQSISHTSYPHYEVIIVDQNDQDILREVVQQYSHVMPIIHLRVCFRGAAKARNYGVSFARGSILCFPDDDCEFLRDTFQVALQTIDATDSKMVFGRTVDRRQRDTVNKYASQAGYLSLTHLEGKFTEATMFVYRDTFINFQFDETFGVGTFYGSEEAYDLVLRMLKARVMIHYSPKIMLYHPTKIIGYHSSAEIRRVFTYRCGFAHLCLRHQLYKKLFRRIFLVSGYIVYLSLFNRNKVRYYFSELLGIITGIIVR